MKRLALLAAGAILLLGGIAVVVVLLAGDGGTTAGAPQVPVELASRAPAGAPPPAAAPSPSGPAAGGSVTGLAPGVVQLALPAGRVAAELSPHLGECFRLFPANQGQPTILALELVGQPDGTLVVEATEIRNRGSASPLLVDCARRALAGQRVAIGRHAEGRRYAFDLGLVPPAPGARPRGPAEPPKPATGRGNLTP